MTTPTESSVPADSSAPPAWRRWLLYVTAALMPFSINLERVLGQMKQPRQFSPLDILLIVLGALMLIDLVTGRKWARFKFPNPAAIVWALVAIASFFWLLGKDESLVEFAKAALNPLIVVTLSSWIFSNITDDAVEFRKFALILCGSFGVCVLWALYQYIGPVGIPYSDSNPDALKTGATNIRLGGWYDNRMLFAAQAAMLVPAATAFAVFDKDPVVKAVAAVFAALALCVTMAVGGFLGAVAGALAVAGACVASKCYKGAFGLLAGLVIVVVIVLPRLPEKRNNAPTLLRGLSLIAKTDPKKDEKKTTPRLRRYQAAIDFLSSHRDPMDEKTLPNWIFGAGAGRYNARINEFYDDAYYPKPGAKTNEEARFDIEQHERDGFGLIEKTGVELGAVGLAALVFLMATWLVCAAGAFLRAETPEHKVLALASLGACVGAAVISVFAFPTQRGVSGGTFAFFFGLATWLNSK